MAILNFRDVLGTLLKLLMLLLLYSIVHKGLGKEAEEFHQNITAKEIKCNPTALAMTLLGPKFRTTSWVVDHKGILRYTARRSLVAVWICVAYDGSILCRL